MHIATILLGSNINAEQNLKLAEKALKRECKILNKSNIYYTKSVGTNGPDFLNQAINIQTPLKQDELKYLLLRKIEHDLGRIRKEDKYAARTIDLDIIIFDNQVVENAVWKQCFIASPVSDLHPDLRISIGSKILRDVAAELQCKSDIKLFKRLKNNL
jgi:2-amino-4-hydroxy-6-hydroxymethyldihydropteridine diphosphokinase